ncbi:MAG: FAD-dependent oxidoreductase [Bauldia litoralis]
MKDRNILILGGGFAGARLAQELTKSGFSNVTLVDRKDYFEVTYSTLRTLAEPDMGERARLKYADFIKSGFRQGNVTELGEHNAKLDDGTHLGFDIAVAATGSSYRSFPVAKSADAISIEDRAREMAGEHERLVAAQKVLILGGGAVGVELAGEIAGHYPDKSVTVAEAGDRLLGTLKPRAGRIAERQLKALGVNIRTGTRLSPEDPEYRDADIVYMCVGLVPNTELMQSRFASSLDGSGRIRVDDQLRVVGSENIYAIGDCASIPAVKFGYVADAQGLLLAKNFAAMADGKLARPYKPQAVMSLVPVGRKQGLIQLPFGVTTWRFLVNMKQKDMFISRQFGGLGVRR